MATSIFTIFTLAHCLAAVIALGSGSTLRRRLRNARLIQAVAAVGAAVLIPANVYCAFGHDGVVGRSANLLVVGVAIGSIAALCVLAVLVLSRRITRSAAGVPRRVLVVGAHPDDLELACGGTIAKLADAGHEVNALVMSDGGRGGTSTARRDEAQAGASFLGTAAVQVLGFSDTRLTHHDDEMVTAIEAEVRRFAPDLIFTHSANDQHQDHRAVHLATLRAARQHPAILCFESPSATSEFQPSVFVDIDGYVDVKVAAVACHRGQRAKAYMRPERVRALAVHRGGQARIRYAEGYEPVRLLGTPLVEL